MQSEGFLQVCHGKAEQAGQAVSSKQRRESATTQRVKICCVSFYCMQIVLMKLAQ